MNQSLSGDPGQQPLLSVLPALDPVACHSNNLLASEMDAMVSSNTNFTLHPLSWPSLPLWAFLNQNLKTRLTVGLWDNGGDCMRKPANHPASLDTVTASTGNTYQTATGSPHSVLLKAQCPYNQQGLHWTNQDPLFSTWDSNVCSVFTPHLL